MASRISVEAEAFMLLQHEVRAFRERQAQELPSGPEFHLRQGTITARDPASYTVSVLLSAADTSDTPSQPIPGIRLADTVYPIVGAGCWVAFNGPEPCVLHTVGSPAGAVRAWRGTARAVTQGAEAIIELTSDLDDTDNLHTATDFTSIVIGWPGRYSGGANAEWDAAITTGVRRLVSVKLVRVGGGAVYIARSEDQHAASGNLMTQSCSFQDVPLAAGDRLQLAVFQGGTGALNLNSVAEFSPVLEARWQGP